MKLIKPCKKSTDASILDMERKKDTPKLNKKCYGYGEQIHMKRDYSECFENHTKKSKEYRRKTKEFKTEKI